MLFSFFLHIRNGLRFCTTRSGRRSKLFYLSLNAKTHTKDFEQSFNTMTSMFRGGLDYFKIFIRSSLLLFYLLIKAVFFLSKDENLMGKRKKKTNKSNSNSFNYWSESP